jgi:hypothetical protein
VRPAQLRVSSWRMVSVCRASACQYRAPAGWLCACCRAGARLCRAAQMAAQAWVSELGWRNAVWAVAAQP